VWAGLLLRIPFAGYITSPITLNHYGYALNTPVLRTDRSGLDPTAALKSISGTTNLSASVAAFAPSAWQNISKSSSNGVASLVSFLSGKVLPVDIYGDAEKLEIQATTEANRLKWYRHYLSIIIDDIADLIDTGGFTVDQAISVGTRMAPSGVDILEVERLRPLFIQYQQHTVTVPQIKAKLLGSQQ
jgi:hypothetical protein